MSNSFRFCFNHNHIYSIRLKLVINFKTHITYIGNRIPKEQGKGIIQKTTESKDKSKLTCQNEDIVKISDLPYL